MIAGKDREHALTALAVWEAMLEDLRGRPLRHNKNALALLWEFKGTAAMRELALDLAPSIDEVWEAGPPIAFDGYSWDWDVIPAILKYVNWEDGRLMMTPKCVAHSVKLDFRDKENQGEDCV